MANKGFHPEKNPAAGTVPHADVGKHKPSSGPGAKQGTPPSTTGNAALDTDQDHAEQELEALYPRKGKRREQS